MTASAAFYELGAGSVCHPWNCITAPALPVTARAKKARLFGNTARRPEGELIKDLLLTTPPRTWRRRAEDMGYHDHGRPGTDLRTASLRPRTMEKGLGKSV